MDVKRFMTAGLVVSLCLLLPACSKRETPQANSDKPKPDQNTILRVHWAGKATLAADTNAAGLMKIWELPESRNIEAQALNRLATAPWRARMNWPTNALHQQPTGTAASLRILLGDVVNNESFFEIRRPTNGAPQFAIAVKLAATNVAAWRTNLALVAGDLLGSNVEPSRSGWQIKAGNSNVLTFAEVKKGVCITWACEGDALAGEISSALDELDSRSRGGRWLQANARLPELLGLAGVEATLASEMPTILLGMGGDGTNVITSGELKFPRPLPIVAQKWQIPTNLIHDPVQSFGAIQGFKHLLGNSKFWAEFTGGVPAPNQYFWWAQQGAPFLNFGAFPVESASNAFSSIAQALPAIVNSRVTNLMAGRIIRDPFADRLSWAPFPAMAPTLQPAVLPNGEFLHLAMAPTDYTNRPAPPGIIGELAAGTNAVYYHRELTGARFEPGMYVSQLLRLVARRHQLPFDSASIAWFRNVGPSLGNATTWVRVKSADSLELERVSSTGFTMSELQLIGDWLESPRYPLGTHTSLSKLPSKPVAIPGRKP